MDSESRWNLGKRASLMKKPATALARATQVCFITYFQDLVIVTTKKAFFQNWRDFITDPKASWKYPVSWQQWTFKEARAYFRVYCGRAHGDTYLNKSQWHASAEIWTCLRTTFLENVNYLRGRETRLEGKIYRHQSI
jgi:hypothetical protein